MADFTIIHDDRIIWMAQFGNATTIGLPQGNVISSARTDWVTDKPPALLGDEVHWQSAPIAYVAPPYVTPGVAVAWVVKLGTEQIAKVTQCETKPVVLKGKLFTARLEVTTPATMPTAGGPVPDPTPTWFGGHGQLVNANRTVKMT